LAPTLEHQHEMRAARGGWAVHVMTGRAKHHRNAEDDNSLVEDSKQGLSRLVNETTAWGRVKSKRGHGVAQTRPHTAPA
jgi:hypothetical protein